MSNTTTPGGPGMTEERLATDIPVSPEVELQTKLDLCLQARSEFDARKGDAKRSVRLIDAMFDLCDASGIHLPTVLNALLALREELVAEREARVKAEGERDVVIPVIGLAWIPVSRGLPKRGDTVLLWYPGCARPFTGHWYDVADCVSRAWRSADGHCWRFGEFPCPTHWMPLPDSPAAATTTPNAMTACKCISYNRPDPCITDGEPEVILSTPPHIEGRPNGICVDACIADAIRMLWSHKVETMGCCCGHNRANPSLVISESEDASRVKRLLTENDGREWDVMQWRLVTC